VGERKTKPLLKAREKTMIQLEDNRTGKKKFTSWEKNGGTILKNVHEGT